MTRKNYNKVIGNIHKAYCEEAKVSMVEAAEDAKRRSGSNDLTDSFDGT